MFNNLRWNWKSFLLATVIAAFFISIISVGTGVKPSGNRYWTILWIYLTIEAWKIWKWDAFYAYPGYLLTCGLIAPLFGNSGIVLEFFNLGGLAAFAYYLNKDQGIKNIDSNQIDT